MYLLSVLFLLLDLLFFFFSGFNTMTRLRGLTIVVIDVINGNNNNKLQSIIFPTYNKSIFYIPKILLYKKEEIRILLYIIDDDYKKKKTGNKRIL